MDVTLICHVTDGGDLPRSPKGRPAHREATLSWPAQRCAEGLLAPVGEPRWVKPPVVLQHCFLSATSPMIRASVHSMGEVSCAAGGGIIDTRRTSASQTRGSTQLGFAVAIKLYIAATRSPRVGAGE